jgi:hypothetical protein
VRRHIVELGRGQPAEHERVRQRQRDQRHLGLEHRVEHEVAGFRREQEKSGTGLQQQRGDGDAPRRLHERCRRSRREHAEQAQIHDRERASEQSQAEDVADVGRRVEPHRLPDRRAEARLLERDEQRGRGLGHQRISTVLPSIVMRSARISSFSAREG